MANVVSLQPPMLDETTARKPKRKARIMHEGPRPTVHRGPMFQAKACRLVEEKRAAGVTKVYAEVESELKLRPGNLSGWMKKKDLIKIVTKGFATAAGPKTRGPRPIELRCPTP